MGTEMRAEWLTIPTPENDAQAQLVHVRSPGREDGRMYMCRWTRMCAHTLIIARIWQKMSPGGHRRALWSHTRSENLSGLISKAPEEF